MTIPWLMNCGHNGDGWCLDCVKEQRAELDRYRKALEEIAGTTWYSEDHCVSEAEEMVRTAKQALKDA